MKAPSAMRDLLPCPPCGRQGRPGKGTWQARISEPRGSAPRERDHRGGDHPVPSRTRQLSPPSPRVLQRKAAGGQGVALAEGAFLSAPRRPAGEVPPAGFFASWGTPEGAFPRPGGSTDGGACVTSADRGAGARPEGRPCRAVLRSGAARLLGSALYALRVISPGASDGFLCAVGWSEAGFLSLCAASRFGFLLVTESAYVDYNLKAIYSSLAQCGCRGLCESLILARTFGACKV